MIKVIHTTEYEGYSVERIERTYPSGKVELAWRTNVPHPDVRTQSWISRTRKEALAQGEWLKVGGGRDQATVRPALTDGPYAQYALDAIVASEVLTALYDQLTNA